MNNKTVITLTADTVFTERPDGTLTHYDKRVVAPYIPVRAAEVLWITRDTQRDLFGLFAVNFGTTSQEARHKFTSVVLDGEKSLRSFSWSLLTEDEAQTVKRALLAQADVEHMLNGVTA